jgi:hypothetical protein
LLTFTKRLSNELLEHEGGDIKEIIKRQWAAVMDDPHHLAWAELTAFANLERPHLYDLACELLRESGHEVYELDLEKAETTEHKLAKEEGKQERAEAVAAAKIITIAEAEKIQKQHSARKDEILSAERAVLADRLPGIPITPELVLRVKKERNLISGLQNFWLFHNPDKAKQLRRFRYEEGKMLVFASDHKTTSLVLQALKNLNISQFLEPDRVWTNDSPEVLAVAAWGKSKKAKLIDKAIGEQEDPIHYLQNLLGFVGVKLVEKPKDGTKREYSYLPDRGSLPADFNELYAAVSSKMSERYEEKVQKQDAKKRSAITSETLVSTSLRPDSRPPYYVLYKQ